jgi:phosphatidate cytidylyltransferase
MIDPMPRDEGSSPWQAGAPNELVKRAASGAVLISLVLAAVWLGGGLYILLIAAVSLVLAWEWGRVVRRAEFDVPFTATAISLVAAIALAALGRFNLAFAALGAGTLAVALTRTSPFDWLSAAGVPYLGISAISMIWLRNGSEGVSAVLFVFACVWAHDTVAMFTGRTLRGPRLWPQVSPQKTWAGAIGGLAASALIGALAALIIPGANFVWLTGLGLIIGIAAFLGDLAESALKRLGGLKNASSLIPGHGGFLDRLDGAILSFTLAALIALMVNAGEPGRGLLFGH